MIALADEALLSAKRQREHWARERLSHHAPLQAG
jgi:hypothetical protein